MGYTIDIQTQDSGPVPALELPPAKPAVPVSSAAPLGNSVPPQVAITGAAGTSGVGARSDHTHAVPVGVPVTPGGTSNAEGTSGAFSRGDHKHALPYGTAVAGDNTTANGSSDDVSRADHKHAHGNLIGGALHALASLSAAGFMSSADKAKLDALVDGHNTYLNAGTVGIVPVDIIDGGAYNQTFTLDTYDGGEL